MRARHLALFGNTEPGAFNNTRYGVSCPAEEAEDRLMLGTRWGGGSPSHLC